MGGTLRTYVHVHDENGQSHVFGPGDEVPGWAEKLITNPAAWEDGGEQTGEQDGEPPRSGKGSGKEAWAAYATAKGVQVPDEATTREDIIAALVQAGVVEA